MSLTNPDQDFSLNNNERIQEILTILGSNVSKNDLKTVNKKILISNNLMEHGVLMKSINILLNIKAHSRNFYKSDKPWIGYIADRIFLRTMQSFIYELKITPKLWLKNEPFLNGTIRWSNSEYYLDSFAPKKDLSLFIESFDLIINALSSELKRIEIEGPNKPRNFYKKE